MPFINNTEMRTIINIEEYLRTHNIDTGYNVQLAGIVEDLMERHQQDAERSRIKMREMRAIDKNYGRSKSAEAKAHDIERNRRYYHEVAKYRRKEKLCRKQQ